MTVTVGMTAENTCVFRGCQRPVCSEFPETCDRQHHLQVMSERYCLRYPQYDRLLRKFYCLDENDDVCSLDECDAKRSEGQMWCSPRHNLLWLNKFYAALNRQGQICKLQSCSNHVYVQFNSLGNDNLPVVEEFCSWKHRQEYFMRAGLSCPVVASPAALDDCELSLQTTQLSFQTVLKLFKEFVRDSNNKPANLKVDDDFFNKHPWDVLKPGVQACWMIVKLKYKNPSKRKNTSNIQADLSKGMRHLVTKDGYHWKPHGAAKDQGNGALKRYLKYTEKGGNKKSTVKKQNDLSYRMEEYTIPGVEDYGIVYLHLSKTKRVQKASKRQKLDDENAQSSSSEDEVQNVADSNCNNADNHLQEFQNNATNEQDPMAGTSYPLEFTDEIFSLEWMDLMSWF